LKPSSSCSLREVSSRVDDSRNWPEALGQHRSKGIRGERHLYGCANVAPLRAIGDPTPR
jgi:hypothetical protein